MSDNIIKIVLHILAWLTVFLLPFVIIPRFDIHPRLLFAAMLPNILLIIYFYSNQKIFVPFLLMKKRYLYFVIITITIALIYFQLMPTPHDFLQYNRHQFDKMVLEHHSINPPPRPRFFIPFFQILLFFLVFIISTGIELLQELFETNKNNQIAETARAKAELAGLKAQINPHFLFNTLNSIYSLSVEKSPKTPEAIVKLSGMMRYVLTESVSETVPLNIEIDYIKQYIDLQKLRLTDLISVDFEVDEFSDTIMIAPLLLEPFIENAFKYGVSVTEPSFIKISLKFSQSEILFMVINRICNSKADGAQLGIRNVSQRLQLLYKQNYKLQFGEVDDTYQVKLQIPIV